MPLTASTTHYSRDVLVVEGVDHVPEVAPVGEMSGGQTIWKVDHSWRMLLEHRPKLLHGELGVDGDVDESHFAQLEQTLLLAEDLLQRVLVQHL